MRGASAKGCSLRYVVTGGAGFIGSHLTDLLLTQGHEVWVYDNLRSGYTDNLQIEKLKFILGDINDGLLMENVLSGADGCFHLAAIARTPWCLEDPILAGLTNAHGTLSVLESCRQAKVRRVILASSNVIYAARTPYRASKEMLELWTRCYVESYGLSALALRFSNVYGPRQSEHGPSPNVFAAFRKSLRERGYIEVTGDGEQSRDFTNVSDISLGLVAAMTSNYTGEPFDLCTGKNWTMNEVCKLWDNAPVRYVADRPGDVKHIRQSKEKAHKILGWSAKVDLKTGIKDVM
jgi:UDP-glucose 4-epimerase